MIKQTDKEQLLVQSTGSANSRNDQKKFVKRKNMHKDAEEQAAGIATIKAPVLQSRHQTV